MKNSLNPSLRKREREIKTSLRKRERDLTKRWVR